MAGTLLIDEFNQRYSLSCSIFSNYWKTGVSIYSFHEVSSIDERRGTVSISLKGYYADNECYLHAKGFNVSSEDDVISTIYPVSNNELTGSVGWGEFKAINLPANGRSYKSTHLIKRYWAKNLDAIKYDYPEKHEEIKVLVISEIKKLADVAVVRGYARGWVYHKFWVKVNQLDKIINENILLDTEYYFSSIFAYNQFSDDYVVPSKKEREKWILDSILA